MFLVGDIGGTSTRLALMEMRGSSPFFIEKKSYPSAQAQTLEELLATFLQRWESKPLLAVSLAVPGPVYEGRCQTTNLPWRIDGEAIRKQFSFPHLFLLNDVEGHAWAVTGEIDHHFRPIFPGVSTQGSRAVIAPGTGLGEAGIFWDGARYHPFASEGGHCDFAPRGATQQALATYLEPRWPHLSYERLLSGPGLVNLYEFYRDVEQMEEPEWLKRKFVTADRARIITECGIQKTAAICEHALDLFVVILGAEVGNCALKYLPRGGIFLGGGIPRKILPKLQEAQFVESYLDKGRMRPLLEKIAIFAIDDEFSSMRGAAHYAATQIKKV